MVVITGGIVPGADEDGGNTQKPVAFEIGRETQCAEGISVQLLVVGKISSEPRVKPNVLVSISVGLKVYVSLIANRCAAPPFGPLPQGSAKFLKQL